MYQQNDNKIQIIGILRFIYLFFHQQTRTGRGGFFMPPKRTDTGDLKKCHFETIRFASTYDCLLLCVVLCYWYVYHRRSSSLRYILDMSTCME